MTSTARASVWISFFLLLFFVSLGYITLKAEETRSVMQVQCVEAGGSVEKGECVNR